MDTPRYDLIRIENRLKRKLDKKRFLHTEGVMYTACALAMAHALDIHKAQTAGLLHDCAKCIPDRKKLILCKKFQIPVSSFEAENPSLLHAKLGAYLAKSEYGVADPEILSAITWHTTGKQAMSELEEIIYIADYIEPGRNQAPNLTEIRKLAFQDLNECMYHILKDTIRFLKERPDSMDDTTEDAYLYYSNYHNSREE